MARTLTLRSTLARILSVVGAGSASAIAACGGETTSALTPPPEDSGGTGGSAGTSSAGRGGTGATAATAGTGGATPSVDGSASGGSSGTEPGRECLEQVKARRNSLGMAAPESPQQVCGNTLDARPSYWDYVCFAAPPAGETCATAYDPTCVQYAYSCGLSSRSDILCGPLPPSAESGLEAGACCYLLLKSSCPVGRPFIVGGVARLAPASRGEGWRTKLEPDTALLDPETRRALADVYRQDGLTEHASVASFARFVLQCLALGAPADIVAGAQRAGLEEIEHARLSFGLASAYSGSPERPLGIDVAGALEGQIDPCAVAVGVAREGCIAETVSALLIAAARDAAEDPVVGRVLAEVAEQELEHALLAWRYLRWALERGDRQLRRAVARVFARPELAVGLGATPPIGGSAHALRAHGCLSLAERQTIAFEALRSVVAPAARALLDSIAEGTDSDPAAAVAETPRA